MGGTSSHLNSTVSETVERVLPEAPQLFSPEEVVEFSWMAALHLHLPFDPIDAEVRLDVPAEAADVPSIDRSTAHQKLVQFLDHLMVDSPNTAAAVELQPDAASPRSDLAAPLEEHIEAARSWLLDFDKLEGSVKERIVPEDEIWLQKLPSSCVPPKQGYTIADITTFYFSLCTAMRLTGAFDPMVDEAALSDAQESMGGNHVVALEHAVACVAAALRVSLSYTFAGDLCAVS